MATTTNLHTTIHLSNTMATGSSPRPAEVAMVKGDQVRGQDPDQTIASEAHPLETIRDATSTRKDSGREDSSGHKTETSTTTTDRDHLKVANLDRRAKVNLTDKTRTHDSIEAGRTDRRPKGSKTTTAMILRPGKTIRRTASKMATITIDSGRVLQDRKSRTATINLMTTVMLTMILVHYRNLPKSSMTSDDRVTPTAI